MHPKPVAWVDLFGLSSKPCPCGMEYADDVLFHYTNKEGLDGILDSNNMKPSLKASNPKDARYEDGQYFSDIKPGTKTGGQLSRAFYGIPFLSQKVSHYIVVSSKGLNVKKGADGIFVILNDGPLDLKDRIVDHGKNEIC